MVSNDYLGPAVYMLYMHVLPVWVWVGSHTVFDGTYVLLTYPGLRISHALFHLFSESL